MPDVPSAEKVAEWAVAAVAASYAELRERLDGVPAKTRHDAFSWLHHASARPAAESREAASVRRAAMELLIGLVGGTNGPDAVEEYEGSSDDIAEAWRYVASGLLDEAEAAAAQALASLESLPRWNRGNVIHHAHLVMGHASLRRGDIEGAEEQLLAAADTPGSPQLDSFGPNMSLAEALLDRGRSDTVVRYFDKCAEFWGRLRRWRAQVQAGEKPNFRANLVFGIPRDVATPLHAQSESQESRPAD